MTKTDTFVLLRLLMCFDKYRFHDLGTNPTALSMNKEISRSTLAVTVSHEKKRLQMGRLFLLVQDLTSFRHPCRILKLFQVSLDIQEYREPL